MNIVSLAMNFIGPAVVSKIASSLGINSSLVNKAISVALPAILGGAAGRASTQGGLGSLFDMVSGKQGGMLDSFAGMLGTPDESRLMNAGQSNLSALLGDDALGSMAGAVGRHAGIDTQQANSLLGLVGPVALGALGNEVQRSGLDARGLATFLDGQKQNIADAMPQSFMDDVSGSGAFGDIDFGNIGGAVGGIVDDATGAVERGVSGAGAAVAGAAGAVGSAAASSYRAGANAVDGAADAVGDAARDTGTAIRDSGSAMHDEVRSSGFGWLKWLIGLILLAAIAWFVWTNFLAPTMQETAGTEQSVIVGDTNVGAMMGSTVDSVRSSIGSITDEASARAALPDLVAANDQFDAISGMTETMGAAEKGVLGSVIGTALESLRPMIEKVLEIPGVGPVVGPALEGMIEKLEGMAG